MSIMTRVLRIFKADMHGVMDQLEDKDLLLKQYLREMETDLQRKEACLQHLTQRDRQVQADHALHTQEIEQLEQDLNLALRKEKDDIARLLIRRQRTQQKQCEYLQHKRESLQEDYTQLAQLIEDQRLRYETLKVKAEAFYTQKEHNTFAGSLFPIDEEEIELELMVRKEQMQEKGGIA